MQLLGNYQSNLTAFLYEQLLNQLETSISQGQFGAGKLFDTAAAEKIQAEGQNFTSITVPSAGNTAYAADLNVPLDTLQARYTALTNEVADLQGNIDKLLLLVDKEASLLDKTIAAAEVENWGSQQPSLSTAQVSQWSFQSGHGVTSTVYPGGSDDFQEDPSNGVTYPAAIPNVDIVLNEGLSGDGSIIQGIGSPHTRREFPVKDVQWVFTPNSPQSQFEEIYGDDQTWAYLAVLEPSPILTFGSPNISVVLPVGGSAVGVFQATGSVAGGSLPVFVRILFHPRQQTLNVVNATANQQIPLSPYNVTANTVQGFNTNKVFAIGPDFTVNDHSVLIVAPTGAMVGQSFTLLFQEYFPAYQCSIDSTNWSPIFMLDPNRPYPDDTIEFFPINVQNGQFPLSDELGVPLGLFIQMVGQPAGEMLLQITTPGSQTFGEVAQLTVSMERASYMNGLRLAPFTNFPATISSIVALGFTDNIQTNVLDIPLVLDREVIIKFPRQLVRKFVINMYQKSYSVKEYISQAPDALRRDTLSNLQSSLPFSVQRPQPSTPQRFEGSMYDFGIMDMVAVDDQPVLPGVFVSGPYEVIGQPEVIRLDMQTVNMPQSPTPCIYLAYLAYNSNNQVIASGEFAMAPGTTIPYPSILIPDHVNFFIKLVFRKELAVAQKLQLQVTTVA